MKKIEGATRGGVNLILLRLFVLWDLNYLVEDVYEIEFYCLLYKLSHRILLCFLHTLKLDQIQGVFPWPLQSLTHADEQRTEDAKAEEEQDLGVVISSHWIVSED